MVDDVWKATRSMEFEVKYQFAVRRRMPWEGDLETLQRHVRAVRTHIDGEDAVDEVSLQTNLSAAEVSLEIQLLGANRETAETDARRMVGDAIRESGAYHQGLFPATEELRLTPKTASWSGLRTPTWRVQRSSVQFRPNEQRGRVAAR